MVASFTNSEIYVVENFSNSFFIATVVPFHCPLYTSAKPPTPILVSIINSFQEII